MQIGIIEDEARITRRLNRMVSDILKGEKHQIFTASGLKEGKEMIKDNAIDLLFLDLNLNGEDGFEVLESVVAESFHTIIVSAYKEKALRAFEFGVLDFVPKPFDQARLSMAVQRMKSKYEEPSKLKYLSIKKMGKVVLVEVENIAYIKGAGVYTEIHFKGGSKEIHSKSLESLSLILPQNFERIHKSYIVDMNEANQILVEPGSKYYLSLNDNTILPIGRTRYKTIKERWFN